MSILKSNSADIITILDQIIKDYNKICHVTYISETTQDGLLRDINDVPIHKNDLVWILPDQNQHGIVGLGRVKGNSACFVNIHLSVRQDTEREIFIRKRPGNVMVVSMDEVRRIIERAKNQL